MNPSPPRPAGRCNFVASPSASPMPAVKPRSWKGIGFGALCALIWGIQPIVSKISIADGLTAADVTVLRFLAAGLVLLPLAARAPNFPVGRLGWARAVVLAILAGAPFSLALVGGVAFAPAFHSAVIGPALTPVTAMLLGAIVLRERPSCGELGALALTLIGLCSPSKPLPGRRRAKALGEAIFCSRSPAACGPASASWRIAGKRARSAPPRQSRFCLS